MNLLNYIETYAERGACCCGKCIDAPANPEQQQPKGHTIDLTFFKVAAKDGASKDELLKLVAAEHPKLLDGAEHSYLEVGADLGSQQHALMMIGMGHVLGAWTCLCPETVMPFLPPDMKEMMVGRGMISMQASKK